MVNPPPLAPLITERSDAIATLCRRYGVERLEVFGSAADGRFDPSRSDVDFIVRLAPTDQARGGGSLGRRFIGLAESLEALLQRRVDLMSDGPIRNPYLDRSVQAPRRVIYERAPEQAPA